MSQSTQQGFPQVNSQIVDPKTLRLTQPWYQLFISLWNRTGGSSGTASSILDQISSVFGSLLFRGELGWSGLNPPGSSPRVLTYQGGDTPLLWSTAGTGSVTDISTGTGLTGGPITTTGTISLNPTTAAAALGLTAVGTAAVGQIPGTATNDDASAGSVGEFASASLVSGSAVSLVTATAKDVVTLSLTAGDWDVWGDVTFSPAGTTTVTRLGAWVSLASAAGPTLPALGFQNIASAFETGALQTLQTGATRISLATTITVYLTGRASFGTSTMAAYGIIAARRVR